MAVTATTGMASLQLGPNAATLHHWAGISDGRYSDDKLAELFDHDDKYVSSRQRIKSAECLVIDEISMLSLKIFEMIDYVCRHVRESELRFLWFTGTNIFQLGMKTIIGILSSVFSLRFSYANYT